jgi:hypothetical protein
MSDKREEIYSILSRINLRRKETVTKGQEIELANRRAFTGSQAEIEMLRRRAASGDGAAEAEYMALVRGKKAVSG